MGQSNDEGAQKDKLAPGFEAPQLHVIPDDQCRLP